MKDKILWICPSRGRPQRLERMLASWKKASTGSSVMLVAIDTDDNSYDRLIPNYPEVIWEKNDPIFGSFLKLTNAMAFKYLDKYGYIGFMEDDVVFETPGYEDRFIQKLKELGETGIVHALDGFEKKHLVSLPVFHSSMIKKLGWVAPPEFKSLWVDNLWRDMAEFLKTYYKFEDVMIRHHHYTKDKTIEKDQISEIVDANYGDDRQAYINYKNNNFLNDMAKLK